MVFLIKLMTSSDILYILRQCIIKAIGLISRVFTNGPRDRGSISGRVIPKTKKMVLDSPSIPLSIIR